MGASVSADSMSFAFCDEGFWFRGAASPSNWILLELGFTSYWISSLRIHSGELPAVFALFRLKNSFELIEIAVQINNLRRM